MQAGRFKTIRKLPFDLLQRFSLGFGNEEEDEQERQRRGQGIEPEASMTSPNVFQQAREGLADEAVQPVQREKMEIDMARPRMAVGKISATMIQTTAP